MKPIELHAAILELIRVNPRKYRFSGIVAEFPQEEKEIIEDRLWIMREIAICPDSTFVALKTEPETDT